MSSNGFTVFCAGLVSGILATLLYERIEHVYWRNPGWWFDEAPSLHAWGLRLMQIGGAGRDGFSVDSRVTQSENDPSIQPQVCFQSGQLALMRYSADTDTLTAIYRCDRDGLGGQLNATLFGPKSGMTFDDSSYVFSVFDTAQDPGLNHLDYMERH